jgi:hypothetical protein
MGLTATKPRSGEGGHNSDTVDATQRGCQLLGGDHIERAVRERIQ